MYDLLKHMEKTFGSYAAVAKYLGYSERHYYNILNKAKSGKTLLPHVETKIVHKLILLLLNKLETVNKESQS